MHAQYFVGAALVRKKEYATAEKVFQALLQIKPETGSQKHIQALTFLGLGRLLYQKGKIADAIKQYLRLPENSKEYDTALFETSWAYVKSRQFEKAFRSLELLVLSHPESPLVPEVKVLQGNLLIRLERWSKATDLFTKTREKFIPVRKRMKQVMEEHKEPSVFFDVLLTQNLDELSTSVQIPQLAIQWVKGQPRVKRALNLVEDMRGIEKSLTEIRE
ncbi:MAG: tetratricopeptide repeat protein, partial [Pseudomonadota bacterium]